MDGWKKLGEIVLKIFEKYENIKKNPDRAEGHKGLTGQDRAALDKAGHRPGGPTRQDGTNGCDAHPPPLLIPKERCTPPQGIQKSYCCWWGYTTPFCHLSYKYKQICMKIPAAAGGGRPPKPPRLLLLGGVDTPQLSKSAVAAAAGFGGYTPPRAFGNVLLVPVKGVSRTFIYPSRSNI